MRLTHAHARFYKSFNFDQARKLDQRVERQPWEYFREEVYPYVSVALDPRITTVVGANESGKSHLLGVIRKAITGEGIEHRDLCRYSRFFGVAAGQRCWPHVGVSWDMVSASEAREIAEVAKSARNEFAHFLMFREQPDQLTIWLPDSAGTFDKVELSPKQTIELEQLLPRPFEIDAEVALPNSIPFSYLLEGGTAPAVTLSRSGVEALVAAVRKLAPVLGGGAAGVQNNAAAVAEALSGLSDPIAISVDAKELASLDLGRRLLLTLGEVDPEGLAELARGIDGRHDGYAAGLLGSVNDQLERKLNLRRYWVQDRDFTLKVSTRDRELVFVISDRTGTVYSFSERSSGLRYFLSYLIQAQVHRPAAGRESILLMDEPDTYLSAEAQQDLMRVFRDLAEPPPGVDPIQVVYVTHSPFLLDKNHAERIRVLEKGVGLEGTRVVPNAVRNHYEPLRSAFGAFVGESAFVGSVNLLVEGPSDQILLAGSATLIRGSGQRAGDDTLDLNRIVIVPSGSAGTMPHAVFRIRGQGPDKPPVVVLLDADEAGIEARRQFETDGRLGRLLGKGRVLDLAMVGQDVLDWPVRPEIEDLVPLPLAHRALQLVVAEATRFREGTAPELTLEDVSREHVAGVGVMDAVAKAAKRAGGRIDKLAFAKAVIEACRLNEPKLSAEIGIFRDRMRVIFRAVNAAMRDALDDAANKKLETLVSERVALFRIDHPAHATRENARNVLAQIEMQLDDTAESEAIRAAAAPLRREFELNGDPTALVENYGSFLERLEGLKHAWRMRVGDSLDNPLSSDRADDEGVRASRRQRGTSSADGRARPPATERKPKRVRKASSGSRDPEENSS